MGSAVLAAPQTVPVTLTLFGGTDTEISPSDCPEGLSPDNQDMTFLPGETTSRPGQHKAYNSPISAGTSVVYQKSYVQPNGVPLNLILTSDGKLWVSDVVNNPAPSAPTLIGSVPPGLYAQSVSAFGREYIAFSDLLHGQGIPLQYDGTNLDRVTQDGPGAAPAAGDESITQAIAASPNGLFLVNTYTVTSATESGFVVTLVLAGAISLQTLNTSGAFVSGDIWRIAGVGTGYNGDFPITSCVVSAPNQLTITYVTNLSGLAPVLATGTAAIPYYIVTNAAAALIRPAVGQSITIAAATLGTYDGTWTARFLNSPTQFIIVMPSNFGVAASGGGTWAAAGSIPIGTHGVVVMFLTRNGALTAPSPISYWTAGGNKRVILGNIPIGNANVVARVFAFTGAGGDNFFTLPSTVTIPQPTGQPIIIQALVLPDNTSSTITLDFSDTALFSGIAIDQIGNDLFDQRVLGPVLGFFAFASRLIPWGDYNKIENFLNMGFCGGYLASTPLVPLGWSVDSSGGSLINGGPWAAGMAWQMLGSLIIGNTAMISQSAYQDSFGTAILQPNTQYIFRTWAQVSSPAVSGNLFAELFSATAGSLAIATIPCTSVTTVGGFLQATFSAITPATIPSDTRLRISKSNLPVGIGLIISEEEIVFAETPYRPTAGVSYVLNPEGIAQTTGNLGPTDDDSAIRNFSLQRNVGLLHTGEATHEFQDSNFEPGDPENGWPVDSLTHSVGALSLRACDPGKFGTGDAAEDWDIIASKNGLYLHVGATFYKVSQEMSRTIGTSPSAVTWDDINWAQQHTVWVKNNVNQRYALIGVPIGEAQAPNLIFVLDYREMDTVQQIASATPIHITLSGKMKSSDLARKWGRWNIKANSAEILLGPGNARDLYLGGGSGTRPGTGTAYGNIYSLDPAKLTDDDYGRMFPYYVTYAFLDHDQEQELGLGPERKLYKNISAFVSGVGLVTITPLINSMSNVMPATSPRILVTDADAGTFLDSDLEWSTNIRGQRVFFRFDVDPLPGTTDVQLKLQQFDVTVLKDPVTLTRQSSL